MTDKEVAEWLIAIKEKYIQGGDEQYDACRREALDIAANRMKERKINSIRMLVDENGKITPLEQPKMRLKYSVDREEYWHYESICPKCENRWISMGRDNFCPACGQPVYEPTEDGEQDEPVRQDP